jgi:hypothetical protein
VGVVNRHDHHVRCFIPICFQPFLAIFLTHVAFNWEIREGDGVSVEGEAAGEIRAEDRATGGITVVVK